jgi:hypothetical protein
VDDRGLRNSTLYCWGGGIVHWPTLQVGAIRRGKGPPPILHLGNQAEVQLQYCIVCLLGTSLKYRGVGGGGEHCFGGKVSCFAGGPVRAVVWGFSQPPTLEEGAGHDAASPARLKSFISGTTILKVRQAIRLLACFELKMSHPLPLGGGGG